MSEPLVTPEQEAQEGLRQAWQRLADVLHEPQTKHILVSIFDLGLSCSRGDHAWDGFWQSADGSVRICHDCGDSILSEVMVR